jgi:hypothetical protein
VVPAREQFLDQLYRADGDVGIDLVIDQIEVMLWAGAWDEICGILDGCDVERLDLSIALALLTMTLVEKIRLAESRRPFFDRVRMKILADPDEAGNVVTMLRGLE